MRDFSTKKEIKFAVIFGNSGSGKTELVKRALESGLKNNSQISLYDALGGYSEIEGQYSYHNYPTAIHDPIGHLNDFKKQFSKDLHKDKIIFIDEPEVLMETGKTGSDLFHLTSSSIVFLMTTDLDNLINNFADLQDREITTIEIREGRDDVSIVNRLTKLFQNTKASISKDTLIENILKELR